MLTQGQRIKNLRKDRKLTQAQVAKALGVSDVTLKNILANPVKSLSFLGYPLKHFICGESALAN